MKIKSDKVSETVSNVVSTLINGVFEIANDGTTVKKVAGAAIHKMVDGVNDAIDVDSDSSDDKISKLKSGLHSIVYAGLVSGIEVVEEEDEDFSVALKNAKDAALAKSKEVLPELLCDKIQAQVSSTFSKKRESINGNGYKNDAQKKTAMFITDSAETLANKSVKNLNGVFSGEMNIGEAIQNSVNETVSDISDKLIDNAVSKTIDKFGVGNYINSDEVTGVAKDLIGGEISLSELVSQKGTELSDKAINGVINKTCDKFGISKYLDPEELLETAKNVKSCFAEYINGDITDAQFFLKVGQDGLFQVAQAWGTSIGTSIVLSTGMQGIAAAITAAASSTIITAVYSELYKYAVNVFEEEIASEKRLNEIRALSEETISVIRAERESLATNSFIRTEQRQKVFNENLNSLEKALVTNDVDLLTSALNAITEEVGGTVQFKSFEEFDEFMLDDSLALEF